MKQKVTEKVSDIRLELEVLELGIQKILQTDRKKNVIMRQWYTTDESKCQRAYLLHKAGDPGEYKVTVK